MKKTVLSAAIITSSLFAATANAAPVEGLNVFTAGSSISSSQMNANFEAVKTAVDQNDAAIADVASKVAALESASGTESSASCGDMMIAIDELSLCVDSAEGLIANADSCTGLGADCSSVTYSVSPESDGRGSSNVSWFQAVAACHSVGKRLPTNYEWTAFAMKPQSGLAGITDGQSTANLGSNAEWVQDWVAATPTNGAGSVTAMNRGFRGDLGETLVDTAPGFVVADVAYGFRCVKAM